MNADHKRILMRGLLIAESRLRTILTELESETGSFILYSKNDDIDSNTKMRRIITDVNMIFKQIREIKMSITIF
jgi:hypothetical protein